MVVSFKSVWRLCRLTALVLGIILLRTATNHEVYGNELLLVNNEVNSSDDDFSCPDDVAELTALLLKDLPAYSNRVIQRTQKVNQQAGIEELYYHC